MPVVAPCNSAREIEQECGHRVGLGMLAELRRAANAYGIGAVLLYLRLFFHFLRSENMFSLYINRRSTL